MPAGVGAKSPASRRPVGEGKTRVIVPMLVLHWTRRGASPQRAPRLHCLWALLPDVIDFLHEYLTAGLLATKLFVFPFSRDTQLTPERMHCLVAQAERCRTEGGAALVTPESLLSMQLKAHELRLAGRLDVAAGLDAFESAGWADLFDESDAVLSHKLQLVYAVGTPTVLPSLDERAAAVSAVLGALAPWRDRGCPRINAILGDSRVAVREPSLPHGGFLASLRLLPGPELDAAMPGLRLAIADAVIARPPHTLLWLQRFDGGSERGHVALAQYAADASRSADEIIQPHFFAAPLHRAALLALRGLLACDVLLHCAKQRHRVDYGVAPGGRRRTAVPFRACGGACPASPSAPPTPLTPHISCARQSPPSAPSSGIPTVRFFSPGCPTIGPA